MSVIEKKRNGLRTNSPLKKPNSRVRKLLIGSIIPIILITLWQVFGNIGAINQSVLPKPSILISTFADSISAGKIQEHLLVSLERVIKGFLLGAVFGVFLGILIGLFAKINDLLAALMGVLRPIPVIAWVPVLIVWMGIDESSKITVIAIASFWPILLNTYQGVRNADKKLLEVATILEKNKLVVLTKVIIPSAMPFIFTGVRLGVGGAWSSVVGAEMIAAAAGIGYMIAYARELSQPDVMFVGVFSIGIIGLLIDAILLRIEKRVLRWNISGEK